MTYLELLQNPKWRVARRVVYTIIATVLAGLVLKIGLDPNTVVDNLLLIKAEDIVQLLKLALGTALIMGLNKLQHELPNLTK